ncbi:cytochrome c family protein [bacterium]|nr:cytochrome c family protein [bacterium]MBU1993554.1 cytochrome c family protein [bacterium]
MRYFFTLLFFLGLLQANDAVHTFAKSEDCKSCHTQIYDEFYGSMHANSTPQKDPIHNAIWAQHPKNLKQEQYACGKCHTPAADNLDKMMTNAQKAMPDAKNETHQAGISCAYCHRIKSIELHKEHNTNIMTTTEKNYFGTLKEGIESPYHGIVSEGNEHMKNGNVCIGCHSHRMNKHGLNVCSTNIDNEMDGANCVSCHMPKIDGSVSALNDTKVHAFHGFAGAHFHSEMLTKHVDISLLRNIGNFIINIDNRTSHALLLHPLRLGVLKVSVKRGEKTTQLKDEIFVRVLGKDSKPAMPWIADTTLKDTMIQANEKRSVQYDFKLQQGDKVDVVLGWFLVNPKALQSLNLENESVATKFHEFKKESFTF